MPTQTILEWEIEEHEHRPKSKDWALMISVIGIAASIASIIWGNILLGIILVISTFLVVFYGNKKPEMINVKVTDKGVAINNEFYPYRSIDSFWVEDKEHEGHIAMLSLLSKERNFMPHIKIPLPSEISTEEIADIMLDFVDKEYHPPSIAEALANRLGF